MFPDGTTLKGVAWVTPLIIGFVIAIALIATAALVYVKRAASNLNTTSNKLPVNLTPILFGGRDQGKKTVTPNLREFQLVSGQEGHTQHVNRRRKTVSSISRKNILFPLYFCNQKLFFKSFSLRSVFGVYQIL